jgi:hypothetical protein
MDETIAGDLPQRSAWDAWSVVSKSEVPSGRDRSGEAALENGTQIQKQCQPSAFTFWSFVNVKVKGLSL